MLGIKYPPVEVRDRNDPPGILPTSDLRRHLSEPLWRPSLRNTLKFCRRISPPPASTGFFTTDGLYLSFHDDRPPSRLHPDSYGSRTSSPTSTAGRLHPDSYGSQTLSPTLNVGRLHPDSYGNRMTTGRLHPDSYGSWTSSPTLATGRLRPDSYVSRTPFPNR